VQAILRMLRPPAAITGGRVLFQGNDVLAMTEEQLQRFRWRQVSLVMQSAMNALNPVMNIGEQLSDVLEVHEGVTGPKARQRVEALLSLVGIEASHRNSYPHQLSGGMRQRVVIAMALALRPALVILDEPTTALDVVVQKEILKQISELQEQFGFSILFITHDLSLMLQFCSHIGVLYAGRLAETAPAATLLAEPQHPYTQGLMSSFPDLQSELTELQGIGGSPPDLKAPPPGCRFHPRCEQAMDCCSQQQPPLIEWGSEHWGACHLRP